MAKTSTSCDNTRAPNHISKSGGSRKPRAARPANVICIGSAERVRPVATAVRSLGAEVVCSDEVQPALRTVDLSTCALVVVPPLATLSPQEACLRLRVGLAERAIPVLVVLRDSMAPKGQGALYWNGAAGVFEWPREKLTFMRILARVTLVGRERRPLRQDERLTRMALKRLRSHPAQLGTALIPTVVRGIAVLEGQVDALWKLDEAEVALAAIPGVADVVTEGASVSDQGLADRDVAKAVRTVLRSAAGIDLSTVAVRVSKGRVTISGEVVDRRELRRLVELARHVRGVRSIENLVAITAGKKLRDRHVARTLATEIESQLPDSRIDVAVFGGVAVVEGRVKRAADRRTIERLAEEQAFVQRVINKVETDAAARRMFRQ